jgi:hypothetical protein
MQGKGGLMKIKKDILFLMDKEDKIKAIPHESKLILTTWTPQSLELNSCSIVILPEQAESLIADLEVFLREIKEVKEYKGACQA